MALEDAVTVTGLTAPTAKSDFTAGTGKDGGKVYNYTLVVQVPLPVLTIKLDLVGDFILPALAKTGIPQGLQWLLKNAETIFQEVVDVAMELIRAIPEIAVSIQVRVGSVNVLVVQLVADKEPFDVPVPTFILDLPNIAVGLNIDLSSLIPSAPPVIIRVPIPVPRVAFPLVGITGGQVQVDAEATVSESNKPAEIINPIKIPSI